MAGIGKNNVVKINSNDQNIMDIKDLENKINICIDKGEKPILVNATLGTTVYGSIDPINEIADLCNKYNIWCHVDAALGGSIMLSKDNNTKLRGLNKVDSITYDLHKGLSCPLQTVIFITKHNNILYETNSMKAN